MNSPYSHCETCPNCGKQRLTENTTYGALVFWYCSSCETLQADQTTFIKEALERFKDENLYTKIDSGYPDYAPMYEVNLTVYSDYSGGTVEMANYKYLTEHEDYGQFIESTSYGYGGNGVGFRVADLEALESPDDMLSFMEMLDEIDSLSDYPVFNEDELTEIEWNIEQEYIEQDIIPDIRRYIEGILDDNEQQPALDADDLSEDGLYELVRQAMEQANEYCIFETGGMPYIDLERLYPEIDRLLFPFVVEYYKEQVTACPALPLPDYQMTLPGMNKPYHHTAA